ncbi:MAG: lipoprotein signal peptidase [Bacteroidales bacterium]|nr:lipoprotein signal peptidase [Bacteroidaceae bacterium]MBR3609343.1 lipoprotein signal peptidase [Bacteroidales bacterium]
MANKTQRKYIWLSVIVILLVLIIDQTSKFLVKTNMYLGESIDVFSWFKILFIENNGMAFGMELGSKLFLTIFRIVAITLIGFYIYKLIKNNDKLKKGYLISISLIFAGALGNIIDCLFYGVIFNAPRFPEIATLFPAEGGYADFMYGRVVDMLYFPLFSFVWPDWIPFVGGEYFEFFEPVFNIADSAITIGIALVLIFYRKSLSLEFSKEKE